MRQKRTEARNICLGGWLSAPVPVSVEETPKRKFRDKRFWRQRKSVGASRYRAVRHSPEGPIARILPPRCGLAPQVFRKDSRHASSPSLGPPAG
jgi:hypothetical protein